MTHYETAASDLPLSTLSVTERVFEGLATGRCGHN
jgi:hypothetical protein